MGCGASRHLLPCLRPSTAAGDDLSAVGDETLGHSFCYHREHSRSSSISEITTTTTAAAAAFKSISGASVSANSTTPVPLFDNAFTSSFSSSASFSALPLQLSSSSTSGPLDRGFFLSGPIERGALSGPLDPLPFSGPLLKKPRPKARPPRQASLIRRSLSERNRPWVVPLCAAPPYPTSLQWAHGKAGEDRVHIVVSEEHHWLFVGIYDGFNGPEAPEFLVANLYHAVFDHLRGLFWEEPKDTRCLWEFLREVEDDAGLKEGSWTWFPRWRYDSDDKVPERGGRRPRKAGLLADHELVLRALARALEVTEVAYLEMTERAMGCNPELALMGSCLLVALMRDDDVYVMNLGDSRAVVAQYRLREMIDGRREDDEGRAQERGENVEIELPGSREMELGALQLSTDHSTNVEDEVLRIREEHPDDSNCIVNGRVKGRLNVTRAFGAGFLKQPKLNNGLLEMFRNEYVGNAPYLSCSPSLCHHKLGRNDQFLVLSSDGLYQYLSNEEVVLHVENFMERFPDGDPAQSLIEELLSRAAKKAGMDFHELLDIPQGDRRKYHDDITVIVISLEGRIWKSSGKYL